MDIVATVVYNIMAKRALLFEQWAVKHSRCAGIDGMAVFERRFPDSSTDALVQEAKCICGSTLTITLIPGMEIASHDSALFRGAA